MKLDILAMGAHPDDVEITCSGTLVKSVRQGYSVGIISLTRGEVGTRGSGELRAQEFDRAAELVGACVHHSLSLPDSKLAITEETKLTVIREIRHYQPTLMFLPYWEDRHPDHSNASRIIQEAAFLSGLKKFDTDQKPFRPAQLIFYMSAWEFEPDFIVDISEVIEEKKQAILAYGSQVHNKALRRNDEDETFISSPQFMEYLMARAAYFGHHIGKKYGEPFKIKGLLEVKDLLQTFGDKTF